jgi:RES domain-containing protein
MSAARPTAQPLAANAFFAGPASIASGPASPCLTVEEMLTTEGNRWSGQGEPTIYLAGDYGVALAEYGRHAPPEPVTARVWPVRVELAAVLDLRTCGPDGLSRAETDPTWVLDRAACARLATTLRSSGGCEGLLVPTVAMLDRAERWNLVIFAERLRRPLDEAVRSLEPALTISA